MYPCFQSGVSDIENMFSIGDEIETSPSAEIVNAIKSKYALLKGKEVTFE